MGIAVAIGFLAFWIMYDFWLLGFVGAFIAFVVVFLVIVVFPNK